MAKGIYQTIPFRYSFVRWVSCITILTTSPLLAGKDYIFESIPNAEPVGQGRMSFIFWDLYDAELYAGNGQYADGQPMALSLTYLRAFEGASIADRSAKEMRRLGFNNEVTLAIWHNQMRGICPNVEKGTTLTGIYTAQGHTLFYQGTEKIGQINDPQFGKYFFAIWLHPETRASSLRAKLLQSE